MGKTKSIDLSTGNYDLTEVNMIRKISNKEYKKFSKLGIIDLTNRVESWMILFIIALTSLMIDILLFSLSIITQYADWVNMTLLIFSSSAFFFAGLFGYSSNDPDYPKAKKVWIAIMILSLVMNSLVLILLISGGGV